MRRRPNLKLLAITLAAMAALGTGIHFLHGYQVKRNAGTLLALADRAEAEGNTAAVKDYLERYVALAPDDTDALARYAILLEHNARNAAERLVAFFTLEKVLRRDPERHEVRRQLVRVAVALRRHTDARDHLTTLLQSFPDDAELEDMLGQCAEANAEFKEAAKWYRRALKHGPERIDCAVRWAAVLRRRLERPEEADRVMDQLIEANPQSAAAYLARARYRQLYHSADLAAEDVAFVQEHIAPDDADVLLTAAELDVARKRFDAARAALRRGMDKHPDDVRLLQSMARLELQAGRRDEAAGYARRALPLLGDRPQALWNAVELLIDVGETAEAQALLARLEKSGIAAALLDYSRARLCIGAEKWAEARRLFDRARPGLVTVPDLLLTTHMLLAVCHQRIGNADLQVAAYRGALEVDPTYLPARLGLAAAAAAAGQTDEAIALYRKLAGQAPETDLFAARLLIQRQLRLPAARRNWTEAQTAFRELPEQTRKSVEGRLVEADLLLGQDRLADAEKLLKEAAADQPKQVEFRVALATVAARQKRLDEVSSLLDAAERDLGDCVELRLARAVHLANRPGKETHALLHRLAESSEKFPREARIHLLTGLLGTALRTADPPLVRQFGTQLAELRPQDVEVRFTLFRLAVQQRDEPTARRLMKELRKIEGEDGTLWRFADAALRIRFAPSDDRGSLAEARARLGEAAKARPHWAPLALLEAELCEREGNFDGAIEQYRHAVSLGERQPQVVRRVVQLLHERRRYSDAQEVLSKLQENAPLTADLGRLAAEVSLFSQQAPEQTLELARQAVEAEPNSHLNQLWLGQILAALEQSAEAEKAYRKAVELKPESPDAWVSLVLFLAQSKQQPAAETVFHDAEKKLGTTLPPMLRAICWEALGDRKQAREQYRAALLAQPRDAGVLRAAAVFYLRSGDTVEAQELLRKLVARGGEDGMMLWARRELARSLAASGSYPQYKEALALIDANLKRSRPAVEDQRMRAMLMAMQPSQRREAIAQLEQSFARLPATAGELFLLAQLYEMDRDWPKARGRMLDLLGAGGDKVPQYLTWFVTRLIQHRDSDEADYWLRALAKLEPKSWGTIQAMARLRVLQGNAEEAIKLLKAVARDTGGDSELAAAVLLEELGQSTAAEELYRQYARGSKRPESALPLATYLARRGQFEEALDLCEKAAAKCPAEAVATVTAGIVRQSRAGAAEIKRVERWLTAARAKNPDSVPLLLALADLRDLQGRFTDAQALYQRVLERDPKNAVACNNLAVLLALQKKHPEALELSQRALDQEGPAASLLDTRAMIYLAASKGDQAVRDLEEAVTLHPTAPRYFHLAQAYRALQNRPAADAAWQKAKALGLGSHVVHPLERPTYERLAAELDAK